MRINGRSARFAVLLLCLVLLGGCGAGKQPVPELETPVGASVDTAQAKIGPMTDQTAFSASVGYRGIELSFPKDTAVGEIAVRVGDRVEKGDVVVRADLTAYLSEHAEKAARLEELEAVDARETELHEIDRRLAELDGAEETVTDALDQREYEIASEERRLSCEELSQWLEENDEIEEEVLTAPAAGTVTAVYGSAGQTAQAYKPLICMTDDSELLLITDRIPPEQLSRAIGIEARLGDRTVPVTPLPEDPDEVSVAILSGTRGYTRFTAEGLESGETGAVVLTLLRSEPVLKVPSNAVFTDDDGISYVYIVSGETRSRRDVRTGLSTELETEILEGLTEGEVVYVGE